MTLDDISQIRVGQNQVGIIGMKQILAEVAKGYTGKPDKEVEAELINRLSKRNYIADRVKNNYGRAFLREFKKFIGEAYLKEDSGIMEIKVLGAGCPRCDHLKQEVMAVMVELELAADIEHVTDIAEIGRYGVMGTPALIINGKVAAVGSVPSKAQIKAWVKEASKN